MQQNVNLYKSERPDVNKLSENYKMYTGYPYITMNNEIAGLVACEWQQLPSDASEIATLSTIQEQESMFSGAWVPIRLYDLDVDKMEFYDKKAHEADLAIYRKFEKDINRCWNIPRDNTGKFKMYQPVQYRVVIPEIQLKKITIFSKKFPQMNFAAYISRKASLEMMRQMMARQQKVWALFCALYSLPMRALTPKDQNAVKKYRLQLQGGKITDQKGLTISRFKSFCKQRYYCTRCNGEGSVADQLSRQGTNDSLNRVSTRTCDWCNGVGKFNAVYYDLNNNCPFQLSDVQTPFGYPMGALLTDVENRKGVDGAPTKYILPYNNNIIFTKHVQIHMPHLYVNLNGIFKILEVQNNPALPECTESTHLVFCANRLMTLTIYLEYNEDNLKTVRQRLSRMAKYNWNWQLGDVCCAYYIHGVLDIFLWYSSSKIEVKIVHRRLQELAYTVLQSLRHTLLYIPDQFKKSSYFELIP